MRDGPQAGGVHGPVKDPFSVRDELRVRDDGVFGSRFLGCGSEDVLRHKHARILRNLGMLRELHWERLQSPYPCGSPVVYRSDCNLLLHMAMMGVPYEGLCASIEHYTAIARGGIYVPHRFFVLGMISPHGIWNGCSQYSAARCI